MHGDVEQIVHFTRVMAHLDTAYVELKLPRELVRVVSVSSSLSLLRSAILFALSCSDYIHLLMISLFYKLGIQNTIQFAKLPCDEV